MKNIRNIAKPNPEFYDNFSQQEILEIIHTLETTREIPLKYSYKGRGAKIWDDLYLKYIVPRWYRTYNVEINLLNKCYRYILENIKGNTHINIIDVGAGNSFPVKQFISRLNKFGKVQKYIALDISEELLKVSQKNISKWFPNIDFKSFVIDIENNLISEDILNNKDKNNSDHTANIFFHLGVTIGNHQNRDKVFHNFRNSMSENDLLIFTNELGDNSKISGGCYHGEQIYSWMQKSMEIPVSDCEFIRRYDAGKDSVVANMKFCHDYTIHFQYMEIDQKVNFFKDEEITLWRFHKHNISELVQELEQAGLQLVHYITNKNLSHITAICSI
ncbi:L-histidine N(alpha)-methyltransferase [Calothrix rhizosoleniae]|uniref:L-histidine N(alpha)-methyltransferase n=1 Tax=Calothrix rhizosoleniae TaxID=888997 RepID=UPI000B49D0BC|nr:L-histidine N(alpha)-methyltransferase [Calothrix rhizosoleniae]